MNLTTRRGLLAAAAGALLLAPTPQASASVVLSYTFVQEGYSEGAKVTGTFSGFDFDGNGILVHFPEDGAGPPVENLELLSFSMKFSGNSLAPAFSLGLDDVFGLIFEIGSGDLGDDPAFDPNVGELTEGIGVIGDEYFYTSGEGPNNFIGGFVGGEVEFGNFDDFAGAALDSSQEIIYVQRVPEPATIVLVIAATLMCTTKYFALRSGRVEPII